VVHTTKKQKLEEHAADRTTEGLKRNLKKEDVDKQKSNKRLQEALEEINKKAALDRIQKKVALRPKSERGTTEESGMPRSQESVTSSSGTGTGSGSGTGTGQDQVLLARQQEGRRGVHFPEAPLRLSRS
ncbi:MAG: hypothetical protein ACXU9K_09095, partial [Thermodesulfobacteriota bacterium]